MLPTAVQLPGPKHDAQTACSCAIAKAQHDSQTACSCAIASAHISTNMCMFVHRAGQPWREDIKSRALPVVPTARGANDLQPYPQPYKLGEP